MNLSALRELLLLIHAGESVETMIEKGYTYYQLADTMMNAKMKGFVVTQNKKFLLTNEGSVFLKQQKPFKEVHTLEQYRIEKISLDKIYIPDKVKGGSKS